MATFNLRSASTLLLLLFLSFHPAHGVVVGRSNRRLKGGTGGSPSPEDEDYDIGVTTNSTTMGDDDVMMVDDDDWVNNNGTDIYSGARKGKGSKKMKSKGGEISKGAESEDYGKSTKSGKGGKGSSGKGTVPKKGRSSKKRGSKISVSNNTTFSSDEHMESSDTGYGYFGYDTEWP